jgi:hypothetical protein
MKAFPLQASENSHGWNAAQSGMDLRDYFAAKAMQGLLSTVKDEEWQFEDVATIAYNMADAMIEVRGK